MSENLQRTVTNGREPICTAAGAAPAGPATGSIERTRSRPAARGFPSTRTFLRSSPRGPPHRLARPGSKSSSVPCPWSSTSSYWTVAGSYPGAASTHRTWNQPSIGRAADSTRGVVSTGGAVGSSWHPRAASVTAPATTSDRVFTRHSLPSARTRGPSMPAGVDAAASEGKAGAIQAAGDVCWQ